MNIGGSNLLSIASRVLHFNDVEYYKFIRRDSNAIGLNVPSYEAPVMIKGSMQPVPRTVYEKLGLDLQKQYWRLWAKVDFLDIERNVNGDNIVFKGSRYQCESATNWFSIDGWCEILCVFIGLEPDVGFDDAYGDFGSGV